jgi:hypothetical protein
MAILTVYTKLLDKTLEGARIIDMGSTKSCECFECTAEPTLPCSITRLLTVCNSTRLKQRPALTVSS